MRPRSGPVHVPGAAAVPVPFGTGDAAVGDAWWCGDVRVGTVEAAVGEVLRRGWVDAAVLDVVRELVRDGTADAAVGDAWWCGEVRDGTDDAAVGEALRDACVDVAARDAVRVAVRDVSDDAAVRDEVRVVVSLADRGAAAPSVAAVPGTGPLGAVVVEGAEGEKTADAVPSTEAPASGVLPCPPATDPVPLPAAPPVPVDVAAPPVPFDVAAPPVPLPGSAPVAWTAARRPTEPPMVPTAAGARPGTCDLVGFAGDRGRDAGAA